ncbi:insulin-like growth factor-binding protein complex acid labile subunit [Drosophila sulfurigaster albostrigata]|uniref:insulin-like growth factor-binding protein complex acid labile subunit n=1 Tax=Drosophila sulfurigaster albostrigata TaxID=89887 RepID=UPI002D218E5F|nr:insulin-like growth factor-binding protein complex acid labile subunit [Drosophila sulfurigaster albostrigata]
MSVLNLSILWLICCVATAATQTCEIENIDLRCQELSSLEDIVDFPITNLRMLEIINTQTKLTIGAANSSMNMPQLTILSLSVSRLELLSEGFCNLPKLFEINISGCGVEQLLASHFPAECCVGELYASDNKLSVLTKDFFSKLPKLLFALFANNSLSHVELPYMEYLIILDLSHNNLATFNITFDNCPSLEALSLNNNNLTQFHITQPVKVVASSAEKVLKLEQLDLSNNSISELIENQFELLRNLLDLNLSGNKISVLKSAHFAGLTSLRYLHLQSNGKLELTEHTFEALKQLKMLDLSYNGLENLDPNLFGYKQMNKQGLYEYSPMGHMRQLKLDGNKLQHLDPRAFEKLPFLKELCLSNNALRVLPEGLFVPTKKLKVLDMRHNQLTDISSDNLKSLNNAKVLLINYNQLTTLPDLNGTLPHLRFIGIDGNPWQSASFAQSEQWLIARKIQYLTDDYVFFSSG